MIGLGCRTGVWVMGWGDGDEATNLGCRVGVVGIWERWVWIMVWGDGLGGWS